MLPAPQQQKTPPRPRRGAMLKALASLFSGLAVSLGVIGTLYQFLYWIYGREAYRGEHIGMAIVASFVIAPIAAAVTGVCWREDNLRGATWGRSLGILVIGVCCVAFFQRNVDILWGVFCPGPLLCLLIELSLQASLKSKPRPNKP
jgi:hypothetical protein